MTQYSGKIIRRNPVLPTQQSASGVWTTEDAAVAVRNNNWPVAGVPDPISRSVRLRSSASAYFSRTPATAGTSNKTFTYSAWVKRGALGSIQNLISSPNAGNSDSLRFSAADALEYNWQDTAVGQVTTTQVFRDPSAWYHIMFAMDTTQATAANRFKLYVNGVQITAFATASYPAQNTVVNNTAAVATKLGQYANSSAQSFDGYMTEINLIDGQALTPSSFGTTDALTGAWIPMPYTGTYGTNGFYLNFKDNTSTTTLGYDYSGNSNNWTANNISLTAGSTYDSMLDVPTPWVGYSATTDTSAVTRGNYSVINPLNVYGATVTDGNLQSATTNISNDATNYSTTLVYSGKWYAEFLLGGSSSTSSSTGVGVSAGNTITTYNRVGQATNGMMYKMDGNKENPSGSSAYGATYTYGDLIGIALDLDASPPTVTFYKNNASQGSINLNSGSASTGYVMGCTVRGSAVNFIANFGQRPLTYTPPAGFKTLVTTNLPTPTILNGAQYMAATLYTGNGTTTQSISNAVNGVSFRPDFVWNKTRSNADDHRLVDVVRGGGTDLSSSVLYSNLTNAQDNSSGYITQTSNGFDLGVAATPLNMSGRTYVAWQWNAGGNGSSNTNGSITSTVSVNTTAGFSVVTFTSDGTTAGGTIGHGLGVAPKMVIYKGRNTVENWHVYHESLGAGNAVYLNLSNASNATNTFNSTAPTSSVIQLRQSSWGAGNVVAYCWAAVAGYSAFGSYTGNGSSDGPFVYLGFRPRWIMIKSSTDGTVGWLQYDSSRNTYNVTDLNLRANTSDAEGTQAANYLDFVSNGVKIRGTNTGSINLSGATYIYAAFAENPFKYSNAR